MAHKNIYLPKPKHHFTYDFINKQMFALTSLKEIYLLFG